MSTILFCSLRTGRCRGRGGGGGGTAKGDYGREKKRSKSRNRSCIRDGGRQQKWWEGGNQKKRHQCLCVPVHLRTTRAWSSTKTPPVQAKKTTRTLTNTLVSDEGPFCLPRPRRHAHTEHSSPNKCFVFSFFFRGGAGVGVVGLLLRHDTREDGVSKEEEE